MPGPQLVVFRILPGESGTLGVSVLRVLTPAPSRPGGAVAGGTWQLLQSWSCVPPTRGQVKAR